MGSQPRDGVLPPLVSSKTGCRLCGGAGYLCDFIDLATNILVQNGTEIPFIAHHPAHFFSPSERMPFRIRKIISLISSEVWLRFLFVVAGDNFPGAGDYFFFICLAHLEGGQRVTAFFL